MPTAVGPNTKGEENLVFGYDLGDTSNSYKGEPATNLITSGLPGYFGSGGQTLYQTRLYGLNSDSGVFQRNYVTNPALADSGTYNNNGGLYKNFTTSALNAATRYIQISFDFYMITRYRTYAGSGTGLNGYIGITNTDSTTDTYGWNTTYSNGSGDDWSNDEAYVGQWQKVSLIAELRGDKNPASINAMYIYHDRFTQGEGIFTNFIITEHTTFPTGPIRYTAGTRSATQGLIDLTGNSTIDLTNVSFDSNAQMTFDGTNDWISIPNTLSLSNFTAEVVVYPTSDPGSAASAISTEYPGSNSTVNYTIGWDTSNRWFGGFYNASSGGWHQLYISAPTLNTHTHYTLTYNGFQLIIYKNGTVANSLTTSDIAAGGNPIRIGRRWDLGDYFVGKIPVAKVYSRALTASEVASNYKAIKGRFNI